MRKLKANEIECRVAQVGQTGCSLLLYKTARVDRAILDEEFGVFNWQNDFKVIDGKMYGGIGIKHENEWIWRWDCGTESNQDAEKGQASDCFKRAGFKWGIGVELYSAPFIFVKQETIKDGSKYKLVNKYIKFFVDDIGYSDNGEINKLVIIDDNNNIVFKLGQNKTSHQNNDIDIIEGLKATDTIKNLNSYFAEHKSKVVDIKAYQNAYTQHAKELKAKVVTNES